MSGQRWPPDQPPSRHVDPSTTGPMMPPPPSQTQANPQDQRPGQQSHVQPPTVERLRTQFTGLDSGARTSPTSSSSSARGARRRSSTSHDQVKHRRTRSGCFTCRNRRVKCDENRPVCDRCRKGDRDCVFPEQSSSKSKSKTKSAQLDSGSSGEEPESAAAEALPTIPDEFSLSPQTNPASGTLTSRSPSTEGSVSIAASASHSSTTSRASGPTGSRAGAQKRSWQDLNSSTRFYLDFYQSNLSHHHYGFKFSAEHFLKVTLLDMAMGFDPLLYALTGFAAYLHTVNYKADGRLQDFLGYYNRSVSMLRTSLQKSSTPSLATLLTVLQLATMEEFLGDWVSLMGHQKAAYQILTSLYTSKTITQSPVTLQALHWYIRFDIYAGLMSGSETVLGREWFVDNYAHWAGQAQQSPQDLTGQFEERLASYRILANDMAVMFGRKARGLVTDDEFVEATERIDRETLEWDARLDEIGLKDPQKLLNDISRGRAADPDGIVDPFEPGLLYGGELFHTNYLMTDYLALRVLFLAQVAATQRSVPSPELQRCAYRVCQLFEAIELCPDTPPGAILGAQASFAVACMHLPKDDRHTMWVRRKFAGIESCGYVFPNTLRARLSEMWSADVTHWWLPNEEGLPPMLKTVRQFISERSTIPHDRSSEDIREMKGLFQNMSLESSISPTSQ